MGSDTLAVAMGVNRIPQYDKALASIHSAEHQKIQRGPQMRTPSWKVICAATSWQCVGSVWGWLGVRRCAHLCCSLPLIRISCSFCLLRPPPEDLRQHSIRQETTRRTLQAAYAGLGCFTPPQLVVFTSYGPKLSLCHGRKATG